MNVYLSLGSNIEPKKEYLIKAIKFLREILKIKEISSLYETEPWGLIKNQDKFLNLVLKCETDIEPENLIKLIKEIEKKVGRSDGIRWGPREIDIDIILYEDRIINRSDLIIPHKYFEERGFVVIPLFEIDRIVVNPLSRKNIEEIYKSVDKSGVKKIDDISFKKDVYSELNLNLLDIKDFEIFYYDEIDSTQKYLMENFKLNRVILSKIQKEGRGRKGNEWVSNKGGLYFSFSVEPVDYIYTLPIITSYSVGKVLKKLNFKDVKIKIPNDVYLNSKKVCGVISEGYFEGEILKGEVIGVGINVNQGPQDFYSEPLNKATSIFIESGKMYFLDEILNLFFIEFKNNLKKLNDNEIYSILNELEENFKIFEEPFHVILGNEKVKVYGEKFVDKKTILVKDLNGIKHKIPLHSIP